MMIDSVETTTGYQRYDVLKRILHSYANYDPELRLNMARKAKDLAIDLQLDTALSDCDKNLGIAFYYLNELDSAEFYFRDALAKYEKEKDIRQVIACNTNLGIIAMQSDDLAGATDYYLEAQALLYSLNDSSAVAKVSHNIGTLKYRLEKFDEALIEFKRTLEIRRNLPDEQIILGGVYHNIANLYNLMGNQKEKFRRQSIQELKEAGNDSAVFYYDMAAKYIDTAQMLMRKTGNDRLLPSALVVQGHLHSLWGRHELALKTVDSAVSMLALDRVDTARLASIFASKGDIFYLDNQLDSSQKYFEKAIAMTENLPEPVNALGMSYQGMARIYQRRNISDSVVHYMLLMTNTDADQRETRIQGSLAALDRRHEYFKRTKRFEEEKKELQREVFRNYVYIGALIFVVLSVGVFVWVRLRAAREITKRNVTLRKVNTELTASRQELNDALRVKDRFFSIIAHDLKNPVAAFKELASTLNNSYDALNEEEQKEFLQALDDSSEHVSQLLENLLMWSRAQRNTISFSPEQFDLSQIVNNAVDPLQLVAQQKKIELTSLIPDGTMVTVDANMVQTIVRNTASNALKFTHEGGEVTVRYANTSAGFDISVSDNGVGMTADHIDSLFRVDKVVSTKGTQGENGTGLGLIICKEFVDKHNGSVSVDSSPQHGTTFTFSFPQ